MTVPEARPGVKLPRADVTKPATLVIAAGAAAFRYLTVSTDRDLRDNATFLYDATKATGSHPARRLSRAKWRRASARWSLAGVPGALELAQLAAWPVHHGAELLGAAAPGWSTVPWHDGAMGVLLTSGAGWAGVGLYRGFRAVQHRETRKIERRVAQAVSRLLGPDADLENSVRVSPDWDADPWVEVTLPESWLMGEGHKARLVAQVGARLGFNNPQGEWLAAAKRPRVTVRPTPAPPDKLLWSEVANVAAGLDVHRVLFGIGTGGRPIIVSYAQDSPHSVFSGAAGKGKSTLMKAVLAQRMSRGTGVILMDYKNSEAYDYIRDLPSDMARVFTRPEVINEGWLLLHRELKWRIAAREADRRAVFRRLDIVVEEANSFPGFMASWWKEQGGKTAEPPCFLARDQLIFMGREYGMHVHYVAQQADSTIFSKDNGSSLRVNFGIRALAGYEKTTWAMLAYSHDWRPEPEGPVGIWTILTNSRVDLVRVPWITDEEAMRLALSGGTGETRELTHGVTLPLTGERLEMGEITEDFLTRPEGTVTLSEFAASRNEQRGTVDQRVRRAGLLPVMKRAGNAGDLYSRRALEEASPARVM